VAQLEFLANLPLLLAFLGLVIGMGLVQVLWSRSAAERDLAAPTPVQFPAEPRLPLQVPARFSVSVSVSGQESASQRLQPISALGRPPAPEVQP
jgi:hypothetical protein